LGGRKLNIDPSVNDERGNGEEPDQLSMEELMKTSLQTLREGEVVQGTVVAVTEDEVMVDIGFKSEGTVPASEFTDEETGEITVSVNDEVEVFIERMNEMEGRLRLSRDRAAKLKIWKAIEASYKAEEAVTGKVLERVKGGLSVDIGIRAFLPGSLVDLRPNRRLEDYIDTEIEAKIISFDRRRSNVVLSRKAVLEAEQSKVKDATMATLEEGKLVVGAVKNITDYGVFVDLGGLDGLLHITDISWGRVGHPSEYFQVGDEVEVVILRFDRERERVSLGYKQRFEDPWVLVPEKYPVGKRIEGSVVSIVDYGAFVALEEGVEGLIHVSEMSWTKKVKNPRSLLEVGQEVEVVVSEVDAEKRRLSLSLRATEPNPWEKVAETQHVGSRVKGVVRNLTDFGAFVEIIPGVDGLVHISDMSWTRRINHPSEVVSKGQEVEAVITSIDVLNQRISLSMKELLPNEWEEYANAHGVGDVVSGNITNITDFGVFVELAPGVEGLCHISEIDRDSGLVLAEMFSPAQPVACRILRVDWHENRIGLSMHGVPQEATEAVATGESVDTAKPTETAMAAALRAGGIVEEGDAAEQDELAAPTGVEDGDEESTAVAAEAEEESAPADDVEDAATDAVESGAEAADADATDAESEPTAEPVEEEEAAPADGAEDAAIDAVESGAEAADADATDAEPEPTAEPVEEEEAAPADDVEDAAIDAVESGAEAADADATGAEPEPTAEPVEEEESAPGEEQMEAAADAPDPAEETTENGGETTADSESTEGDAEAAADEENGGERESDESGDEEVKES
jgi:small subunit ribosomal protein S1